MRGDEALVDDDLCLSPSLFFPTASSRGRVRDHRNRAPHRRIVALSEPARACTNGDGNGEKFLLRLAHGTWSGEKPANNNARPQCGAAQIAA